jgi:hypothetical protein
LYNGRSKINHAHPLNIFELNNLCPIDIDPCLIAMPMLLADINDCIINDFYLETVLPLFPFINGKHPTYIHKTRYEKYEQYTKMK